MVGRHLGDRFCRAPPVAGGYAWWRWDLWGGVVWEEIVMRRLLEN
jgi:hypothetical protein